MQSGTLRGAGLRCGSRVKAGARQGCAVSGISVIPNEVLQGVLNGAELSELSETQVNWANLSWPRFASWARFVVQVVAGSSPVAHPSRCDLDVLEGGSAGLQKLRM